MANWLNILTTSAVVMGLSYTIGTQKIFAPLRERLGGRKTWPGYLLGCPYCNSHWLAAILVPLTGAYGIHVRPQWGWLSRLLDWFLSVILVTVIAAFLRILFFAIDESQGLVRREQREVEAEIALRQAERARLEQERPRAH